MLTASLRASLTAHHLSKSFGVQVVLDDVSFSLNPGERAGLVGPNGCGKTTILRILVGLDKPDAGSVQLTPADLRVGYLPQGFEFRADETLGDVLARAQGDPQKLTAEVERVAEALGRAPDRLDFQREYDAAFRRGGVYAQDMLVVPMVGGSGPNHAFIEHLKTPIATAGIGHPGSKAHAPDENVRLDLFVQGIRHTARIIQMFGE